MSSCHKALRKSISEEKVKAVVDPATQTDTLSDKGNVSLYEITFEEHKNLGAKPKLSSGLRKAKYGDFYDDTKQEEDRQT